MLSIFLDPHIHWVEPYCELIIYHKIRSEEN